MDFLLLLENVSMTTGSRNIRYNLQLSKNKGVVIKIKLRHQENPILTTVEDIVNDIIVVKPVNLHGVSIPRTSFYVDEIEDAKCMRIFYNAPLYVRLRNIKSNIRIIQDKIQALAQGSLESVN
jgi:hypothetical protein